jgi:hypothetical protein
MGEFEETLQKIREEMVGKVIHIPGYNPVGKVVRVDEQGAWLENGGGRIAIEGLAFYHPVKESYAER